MSLEINFSSQFEGLIEAPRPALNFIPDEYKKLQSFINNSTQSETVKKCIPFLDSLTSGYIIPFPIDIRFYYDREKEKAFFEINHIIQNANFGNHFAPSGHPNHQVPQNLRHSRRTIEAVFKFENTWRIKTPPGYSCIFTQPFNRNFPFEIIDGIVDTDKFESPVNFPFYWANPVDEPVILKAGTPMVLVIPFKRQSWKMKISKAEDDNLQQLPRFSKLFDNYKTKYWSKKEYR